MSFDELLLDEPARLEQRDQSRLLWSLATAGAQVRRAVETAVDFGVESLRGTDLPRALLVATDCMPSAGARLITRLSCARTPALVWDGVELPRWAGPADALLVGSVDGRHPRLAQLVAQGVQRGLVMAVVAPAGSQVAVAAAGRIPLHELPRELNPRAARWSILTPLLQALDALGLHQVPQSLLVEIAEALDQQAELNRPHGEAFTSPAKALAVEFADATPLIAGAGVLAGVAARAISDAVQQFAGVASVSVTLPGGVARAGALLRGVEPAPDEDTFFRDRVDDFGPPRPRLVVVGDDGAADDPLLGERTDAQLQLDEVAARRAASALRSLASALGITASGVDVPSGEPLARFAAATAFGDFTASYLALGMGLDPGARGPAERES
ncbi:SIS domain-containing protein [uncultured Jatrophihabitans sp.]|uniref:SIS domain-containing protein n=1 Tax=uncultured Jatrophihabitans sp. TaxID=1610747 RepID=UPI0035CC785A